MKLCSKSKTTVKMSSHKRDREKKLLKPHARETEEEEDTSGGIDVSILERRLEGLRETQECVQSLSMWCQTNKKHSTTIIETWFKVLKNNPVEKRLTLLYLANDVIQHSKKKNDAASVTAWGSAVQKAIPHVRTPSSVSIQIGRMFKIWEERNVYPKEYIKDFQQLLNQVPAKDRVGEKSNKPETYTASADKVSAFEPPTLISKVKLAYRLKSHLGVTFRSKKYVDMDMEGFKTMIKDRNQGHEVIQEISQYLEQLKSSEAKLSLEVEERRKIVETSEIALVFYENVRGEAKIVHAAYNTFTARVLATKRKVDEKLKAFDDMEGTISPVPSPPAAAPSPPIDEDDFGVRPADKCGGSYTPSTLPTAAASYIEVIQNNTKEIPTESKSIDTSVPPPASSNQSSTPNSIYTPHHDPKPSSNPYMDVMTSIQQIQQQAWSTSGMIDSYATMSMSMPNVFMQQFQAPSMPIMSTGYGVPLQPPPLQSPYGGMGYETFQPNPPDHQSSPPLPPPDLSTIPLPPGPNPQPPPPLPQEAPPPDINNMYSAAQPPPPPSNPFDQQEYDPMYSQHSSFSEPSGYDPSSHQYNSQPSTNDISPNRYHPYNNQSGNGRRLSGPGPNNNGNLNSNRYSNNNSSPTGSQIPPLISSAPQDISPMERFTQSLSKNRNVSGNNQPVPESPVNAAGDWSALKNEDISQSNFVQSQNPYFMNNSFNDYDDSGHAQEGMNGNEMSAIEPYIPSNNMYDPSPPGMRGVNRGNMNRGGRGMNPRGHPRGGSNRGGIQNNRGGFPGGPGGFRGARGRGMVRGAGPPRGRGVNMF